ncbi:pseudoazurin [Rhodovulum sp. 12E13]|uniref:pseudoazurin n=1 Tax=Rhodovulum sp. 12E13 TaxID=2203891 RepID=UPI000E16707E|nr:pseudoazurin [Rhodovulum sp. 12E13]RDC71022.1 pseudoazurin [Rhodovulum sp. 12E13]
MTVRLSRRRTLVLAGAAALTPFAAPRLSRAATAHEVQMLNVHPDNPRQRMVFLPRVLAVEPGDTVTFLATDRGHNSASLDGMIPAGAEAWDGRINEEVSVTLEVPGFYGYQCTPHYSTGMVGLIVVRGDGMMDNLDAAQEVRQRGRAAAAFDEIWAEAAEMGLTG